MKIVTYNILKGGLPVAGGANRHKAILTVLREINADIVALQETTGWDQGHVMADTAQTLDLPHHTQTPGAIYGDGARYGVALFSRYPLRDVYSYQEGRFQAAALAATLDTPQGAISLCNTHLHAFDEDARLVELALILRRQGTGPRQIILGDFNAISRHDTYPPSPAEFALRFDVSDQMAQRYRDLSAQTTVGFHPSHPSPLAADHTRQSARRIDYIWASADLAVRARHTAVIRTPATDAASDHYPVLAELA